MSGKNILKSSGHCNAPCKMKKIYIKTGEKVLEKVVHVEASTRKDQLTRKRKRSDSDNHTESCSKVARIANSSPSSGEAGDGVQLPEIQNRSESSHNGSIGAESKVPGPIISKTKDIFISYGREEGVCEFVKQLKADLEANGLSVWLDTDDIPTGSDFHVEIGVALKSCRALIPVLTKKYVHSRYCKGELYVANREKKDLLPVVYEDGWDEGEEGAGVNYIVAAYNWAFFRLNQDDYEENLYKLINGAKSKLKLNHQPPTTSAAGSAASSSASLCEQDNIINPKLANPTQKNLVLIKWKNEKGETQQLRIKQLICNKWRDIGHLLEISNEVLESWNTRHKEDTLKCIDFVMSHWLRCPTDDYPVSWEGLKKLLLDIQLGKVAEDIELALRNAV